MNGVTEVKNVLNGSTRFTYDPNGNLLPVTDAKGQTIVVIKEYIWALNDGADFATALK